MNINAIAERVAAAEMMEFSEPPDNGIFFHGFSKPEMMLSAIKSGQFGRTSLTSIGADGKSKSVPLYNRIWFKKKNAKLYPVLYGNGDPTVLKEKASEHTGLSSMRAEIGPIMYRKENEWYVPGPVKLDDVEVVMVNTIHTVSDDMKRQLKVECKAKGYPFSGSFWHH